MWAALLHTYWDWVSMILSHGHEIDAYITVHGTPFMN